VSAKLTLAVWWATLGLEAIILYRLLKGRLRAHYPFFFAYLSCVFFASASGFAIYTFDTNVSLYQYWYWAWEFVCVIAGYSVVLEVIERGLAPHQGARQLLRNGAMLVFTAIVAYMTIHSLWRHANPWLTSVEVERNLRTAEAILLVAVICAVAYYSIPIGRNVKGIVLGYGLCVATVVIGDTLRSFVGNSFQGLFSAVRSWSYLISLLVWVPALWSYRPSIFERPTRPDGDYDAVVAKAREAVESMRGQLEKAGRR
jgi:hypothetical protein